MFVYEKRDLVSEKIKQTDSKYLQMAVNSKKIVTGYIQCLVSIPRLVSLSFACN